MLIFLSGFQSPGPERSVPGPCPFPDTDFQNRALRQSSQSQLDGLISAISVIKPSLRVGPRRATICSVFSYVLLIWISSGPTLRRRSSVATPSGLALPLSLLRASPSPFPASSRPFPQWTPAPSIPTL